MGVKREHRRRWRLAVGALGAVAVVTVAALAASSAGLGGAGGQRPTLTSTRKPSPAEVAETSAFYRDARLSLSHLLTHLPQQSQLFKALLAGQAPTPATADLARAWANDYATARDLVGRLPAPPAAQPARDLYRLGAMLYVESARTLAAAPGGTAAAGGAASTGAASGGADPAQEVRAARRLQLLGDAAFDAGHRLLVPQTESGAIAVERPAVPAVPDFAADGVAPPAADVPASGIPAPPRTRPAVLDQVSTLARQTSAWMAGGPPVPGGNVSAAGVLRAAATALASGASGPAAGKSGPASGSSQPASAQGSTDVLSLAALVEAEALHGTAVSDSGRRLQAVAADLWSVGRGLAAGHSRPAVPEFPGPGPDAALLDAGGLFNGHPPPLQPGDPPDKDVPGGLPPLNAVLSAGSG
ncbi:MAG TPA: hypothetical protein VGQ80_02245 [Acidimicrobiia bacterium]|nr:hypothetical protein [Acidimicrobiia bacterium]